MPDKLIRGMVEKYKISELIYFLIVNRNHRLPHTDILIQLNWIHIPNNIIQFKRHNQAIHVLYFSP